MEEKPEEKKRSQSHYIVETMPFVVTIAIVILGALLFPFFLRVRQAARASSCASSTKQIDAAVLKYCGKHDGRFPPAEKWNDVIPQGHRHILHDCPSAKSHKPVYAMNARVEGLTLSSIQDPRHTVLVFESRPGENLSGGQELLPTEFRHYDAYYVGFVDGSVRLLTKNEIGKLVWDPHNRE